MSAPTNPHCEHQWPHRTCGDWELERLTAALTGAAAVAKLLLADNNIATSWRGADDSSTEPAPFNDWVRHGLLQALDVCVHDAEVRAELMRNRIIESRNGGAQ